MQGDMPSGQPSKGASAELPEAWAAETLPDGSMRLVPRRRSWRVLRSATRSFQRTGN